MQSLFRVSGGQMVEVPGSEANRFKRQRRACPEGVEKCLGSMDIPGEARPLCLPGMDERAALAVMWPVLLSAGCEKNLKCKRVT